MSNYDMFMPLIFLKEITNNILFAQVIIITHF